MFSCPRCGVGILVNEEPDTLIASLHRCDRCGAEYARAKPDSYPFPFTRVVDEEAVR